MAHTGKIPGSNKAGCNPAHNANPQSYTDVTRGKSAYTTKAMPAQGSAAPQPPLNSQVGLSAKLPKGKGKGK